jgi:isopenicillin N synthase-like dioxygenase
MTICPSPAPLLPWLDLSRLDGRATDHLDFLADLREAAHDVGFFYLTGHGITAKQCGNSCRRPQFF